MIDRSYLPFYSAREYQDPGIQKWMVFFLSEHTTSLGEERNCIDLSTNLSKVQKLLLISQLCVGLKDKLNDNLKNYHLTYLWKNCRISKITIDLEFYLSFQ